MSIQQEAYIGIDCLKDFSSVLKKFNPKRIFLVRGKKSYQLCGAERVINDVLKEFVPEIQSFYDFEENPKIDDVRKGLSILEEFKPDTMIAIGGGSVLDISKLIRFFHSYKGEPTGNEFKKETELLPLLALPTTSGTGCEATHFAVMYKDKVKYSVEHDDILPDYAFVYPPFTYNTPPYLTACTGFDALAQGIEAYWNVNATKESDEYAMRAIQLLWANLPLAVNSPTEEVRNKVAEGAYWAGRAINITKTTAPHAFSYPFTTYYGYPHGHAVALTFPYFAELNLKIIDKEKELKFRKISYHPINIRELFIKYISRLGLNLRLDIHIEKDKILSNINMNRLNNNPYKINIKDAENILSTIINF